MNLLIDDIRDFNVDVIARNGDAGKAMLLAREWEIVYFDHDLGIGSSGYNVLLFALEAGLLNNSKIKLVTSNPVGRQHMKDALLDFGFIEKYPNPYDSFWELL